MPGRLRPRSAGKRHAGEIAIPHLVRFQARRPRGGRRWGFDTEVCGGFGGGGLL